MKYDDHELKMIQEAQVKILKKVDEICKKNDIEYSIIAGTLLGAVRHKGFIPWDDDIDIVIPQHDYDRFLSIAEDELGSDYFLQTHKTNPDYPLYAAKVRANNTSFVEGYLKDINMHHGIYIDVFPYFNMPENEEERNAYLKECCKLYRIFQLKYCPQTDNVDVNKLKFYIKSIIKVFISKVLLLPISKEKIYKKLDNTLRRYSSLKDSKYLGYLDKLSVIERDWFYPIKTISFEEFEFECMAKEKLFLEKEYGNYMQLPPVEKQVNHKPYYVDYEAVKKFLEDKQEGGNKI